MRRSSRRWLGVDGEGVGRKPHRYVLLACSDGDYVEDRHGLSTVDCLEFLLGLGTRDAHVCGYYLSYDLTMMLRDLDDAGIYMFWRPELRTKGASFARVAYQHYELHWLAGATWIRDDRGRKVTIWDLGKYYQGPFVNAIKDWNIRPDVQAEIAEMKKKRSRFTWQQMPKIRQYCMHECEALAEFATKNEQAHIDADLKPRGWFGPGSTAGVLLNRHNIAERRGIIPPPMLEAVQCAFFGGRAEISRTGYVRGPIYGDDISSAYPWHASRLPCLDHGRWRRVTRERELTGARCVHALVHGHVRRTTGAWAPLPIRLENGSIVFPQSGASGWWWRDEWLAAREGWKGLEFDHAFVLQRECDCKPFEFIPQLFDRRRAVGKETGEGKVLKLALNSLYGKLAQTIGKAQFASRVWAGMITSGTRAQVLRRMLQHKKLENVLMIATDGLFTTEQLDIDKQIVLGGWEQSTYDSIMLIRPGIYWLGGAEILPFELPQPKPVPLRLAVAVGDDHMWKAFDPESTIRVPVRDARGDLGMVLWSKVGGTKVRARGLGRDNLDNAKVVLATALHRGLEKVELAPRTAFGGGKLHVYGRDLEHLTRGADYGQWHLQPTHVSLAPGPKRAKDWSPPQLDGVESAPYGTAQTRQQGELFEFLELLRDLIDDKS